MNALAQGRSYQNGLPLECRMEEGKIASFQPLSHAPHWIGPGFTDLQVNGCDGIDYNAIETEPDRLCGITHRLFREGVTSHLATLITNAPSATRELIRQIVAVRHKHALIRDSICGIHLEGPFISPDDGPRGAHPREYVIPPDYSLFQQWQHVAEGTIRMITLSPEWDGANAFIEKCVAQGVIVAIGHTGATHRQITEAVRAGATISTHLGNGMHTMIERHPNYLWSQLADDGLSASIIADGFHLPAEVIRVFQKAKKEKLFLVSDSVSLAGMPPGDYTLHIGGHVTLSPAGRLHVRSNPSILAGAVLSIRAGVSFLVANKIASLRDAWEMASLRPEEMLHAGQTGFEPGGSANVIVLDDALAVIKTIKGGVEVYSA